MTAGDGIRFSVVIATLGRPDVVLETLRSVAACDPPPAEVIVVDGDPEGAARAAVDAAVGEGALPSDGSVRCLSSPAGGTVQRNRGVDEASGDVIVFLDDDVTVSPGVFAVLARAYADPAVVGATGRIDEPASNRVGDKVSVARRLLPGGGREGTFTRFGYPRYVQDLDSPHDVEFMQGAFMSARAATAKRVRFDEALGGYTLGEDEDFSFRLSRLGRVRYLPDAVVRHRKLGFASKEPRAFGRLVVVNRAYLFRKNFPQTRMARLQFALLVLILLAHRALNRNVAGARGIVEGALEAWRDPRPTPSG